MVKATNSEGRKQNEEARGGMTNRTIRDKKRGMRRNPEPVDIVSILRAPAPQPGVAASKSQTPKLTPYAERLLARCCASHPAGSSLAPCDEWITTRVAAKLTGYSQRQIQALCDAGFFVAGREWKQRPPTPGTARPGRILVRHSALRKMQGSGE